MNVTIEPFWFDVGRTKWSLEWLLMNTRYFPEAVPDVSVLCDVLSDQSRAAMCAALMSGTAWTVGELGHYAGVSRSTATEHVNKLVKVDIAHDIRQGRHRYVTLAGSHVAEVIEALGVLSSDLLPTPQSLNAHRTTKAVADARTCYCVSAPISLSRSSLHRIGQSLLKACISSIPGESMVPNGLWRRLVLTVQSASFTLVVHWARTCVSNSLLASG